jgi:1-deoxy-D-xylulose-5-phosphate synthase
MLWTMVNYHEGPIAIRYPRGAGTSAIAKKMPQILEIGKSEVLLHGSKVAIFALGNMCEIARETAGALERQGISTAVINARWIKPLDAGTIEFFARGCDAVCTMEDHVLPNGFGCAVIEHLATNHVATPVVRIGWPDQFVEHGTVPVLRAKHGITAVAAVEKILAVLPTPASAKVQPAA